MGMGMMVVCGTAGRTVVSRSIVIRRRVLSIIIISIPMAKHSDTQDYGQAYRSGVCCPFRPGRVLG